MHHKLPASMDNMPQTAPVLSSYSLKSMFNFNTNNNSPVHHNHHHQAYNNGNGRLSTTATGPPHASAYNQNGDSFNQRYMSQSISDLKRAQHIFGSNELHFTSNKLSSGESDGSLTDSTNRLRSEFANRGGKMNGNGGGGGGGATATSTGGGQTAIAHATDCNSPVQPKINNNHTINNISNNHNNVSNVSNHRLTAPSSVPTSPHKDDKVIRTDSLKENIDKITQLQTKLMSAHSHDRLKDLNSTRSVNELSDTNSLPDKVSNNNLSTNSNMSPTSNVATLDMMYRQQQQQQKQHQQQQHQQHQQQQNNVHQNGEAFKDIANGDNDSCITDENDSLADSLEASSSLLLSTSDAASQTDEGSLGSLPPYCDSASLDSKSTYTALLLRTKYPEELDCEKLAECLVQQLAPTDRLHNILGKHSFHFCHYYSIYIQNLAPTIWQHVEGLPMRPNVATLLSGLPNDIFLLICFCVCIYLNSSKGLQNHIGLRDWFI